MLKKIERRDAKTGISGVDKNDEQKYFKKILRDARKDCFTENKEK